MGDLDDRLKAIEKAVAYNTQLLETVIDLIENKTQNKTTSMKTNLANIRGVVEGATKNNPEVLKMFDSILQAAGPK